MALGVSQHAIHIGLTGALVPGSIGLSTTRLASAVTRLAYRQKDILAGVAEEDFVSGI